MPVTFEEAFGKTTEKPALVRKGVSFEEVFGKTSEKPIPTLKNELESSVQQPISNMGPAAGIAGAYIQPSTGDSIFSGITQLHPITAAAGGAYDRLSASLTGQALIADQMGLDSRQAWIDANKAKGIAKTYQVQSQIPPDAGFVTRGIQGLTESALPGIGVSMARGGIPGAAGGAAVGGVAGTTAGGVGAIPGAIAGAGTGFTLGTSADFYKQGSADIYNKLIENGVDAANARRIALAGGVPYTALEKIQLGVVGKPFKKIAGRVMSPVVESVPEMARIASSGAKGYAKAVGTETATESLQRGLEEAALAGGQFTDGNISAATATAANIPSSMYQEAKDVLPTMTLLPAPGAAIETATTMRDTDLINKGLREIEGETTEQRLERFQRETGWTVEKMDSPVSIAGRDVSGMRISKGNRSVIVTPQEDLTSLEGNEVSFLQSARSEKTLSPEKRSLANSAMVQFEAATTPEEQQIAHQQVVNVANQLKANGVNESGWSIAFQDGNKYDIMGLVQLSEGGPASNIDHEFAHLALKFFATDGEYRRLSSQYKTKDRNGNTIMDEEAFMRDYLAVNQYHRAYETGMQKHGTWVEKLFHGIGNRVREFSENMFGESTATLMTKLQQQAWARDVADSATQAARGAVTDTKFSPQSLSEVINKAQQQEMEQGTGTPQAGPIIQQPEIEIPPATTPEELVALQQQFADQRKQDITSRAQQVDPWQGMYANLIRQGIDPDTATAVVSSRQVEAQQAEDAYKNRPFSSFTRDEIAAMPDHEYYSRLNKDAEIEQNKVREYWSRHIPAGQTAEVPSIDQYSAMQEAAVAPPPDAFDEMKRSDLIAAAKKLGGIKLNLPTETLRNQVRIQARQQQKEEIRNVSNVPTQQRLPEENPAAFGQQGGTPVPLPVQTMPAGQAQTGNQRDAALGEAARLMQQFETRAPVNPMTTEELLQGKRPTVKDSLQVGQNGVMFSTENNNTSEVGDGIVDFVRQIREGKSIKKWIDYDEVTPKASKDILSITGINVDGFVHSIDESAINHSYNRHGDRNEQRQDQEPITEKDFRLLPEVVSEYDSIEPGRKGKNAHILYKKRINGDIFFVEEVRTGRRKLSAVTIYKKKATDTPRVENNSDLVPYVQNDISQPNAQTIPQPPQDINTNSGLRLSTATSNEDWKRDSRRMNIGKVAQPEGKSEGVLWPRRSGNDTLTSRGYRYLDHLDPKPKGEIKQVYNDPELDYARQAFHDASIDAGEARKQYTEFLDVNGFGVAKGSSRAILYDRADEKVNNTIDMQDAAWEKYRDLLDKNGINYSVAYHGTDKISAEDISKNGVNISKVESGYFGKAFYIADDKETSQAYANENAEDGVVITLDVDDNAKILDLSTPDGWDKYSNLKWRGIPVTELLYRNDIDKIMLSLGVDGIKDNSMGGTAIYNPDVIKVVKESQDNKLFSATGNQGTFDSENPDMWFSVAHHGTPHLFQPEEDFPHGRFRLDMIGTGEGAQAYGHGIYFAEDEGVSKSYKKSRDRQSYDILQDGEPWRYTKSGAEWKDWYIPGNSEEYIALQFLEEYGDVDRVRKALTEHGPYTDALTFLDQMEAEGLETVQSHIYKLDIPDEVIPKLLDWDKPLSEQSEVVKNALNSIDIESYRKEFNKDPNNHSAAEVLVRTRQLQEALSGTRQMTGKEAYRSLVSLATQQLNVKAGSQAFREDDKNASEYLAKLGIPGNRYLDGNSRRYKDWKGNFTGYSGEPTYNYVIWDQSVLDSISLLERNGKTMDNMRFSTAVEAGKQNPNVAAIKESKAINGNTVTQDIMFSVRTFQKADQEKYYDRLGDILVKQGYGSKKKVNKFLKDIRTVSAMILNNPDLDYETDGVFDAIKDNADDQYMSSEDYTTLCRKTLKLTSTISAIMKKMNRGLTAEEMVDVRNMMKDAGEVVNCAACYVFSRWVNIGNALDQMANKGKFLAAEKIRTKGEYSEEKSSAFWDATFKGIPKNIIFDMNKRSELLSKYPEAMKWLKARGAGLGKAQENRTEYEPGLLAKKFPPAMVKSQNLFSGMRMQSWSDFDPLHVIDMMQVAIERAALGLAAHGYTKVPDFVHLMAPTGVMVNMSLIPKGNGFDSNGNLVFDDTEGMPYKTALELRKKYRNAGTIAIGVSDEHIRALLKDPNIDYVIPYHASGMSKNLMQKMPELGRGAWEDYTDFQNDEIRNKDLFEIKMKRSKEAGITTKDRAKKVMSYEYWDESADGDTNGKNFLKYAKEIGIFPRFPQFWEDEGYWKLLIDRKMYDDKGKYIQQKPTTLDFNMDTVNRIFSDFLADPDNQTPELEKPHMQTVRKFVGKQKKSGNTNFSVATGIPQDIQDKYKQVAFQAAYQYGADKEAYREFLKSTYGKSVEPYIDEFHSFYQQARKENLQRAQLAAQQQMSGESPKGREDLANIGTSPEAQRLTNNLDESRTLSGKPEVRHDVDVYAQAKSYIEKDRNAAILEIKTKGLSGEMLSDVETVAAKQLYNELAEQAFQSGKVEDISRAAEFLDAYRETGSEVARSIRQRGVNRPETTEQKRNLLLEYAMLPSYGIKRKIDYQKQRVNNKKLPTTDKSAAQEALNGLYLRNAKQIQRRLAWLKKQGWDLQNLESLTEDRGLMMSFLRDVSVGRSSLADRLHEFRLSMMLSAPPTHIVNVVSSTAHAAWEMTVQRGIEATINTLTGSTNAAQWGEFRYILKGAFNPNLWGQAFRNAWESQRLESQVFSRGGTVDDIWGTLSTDSYHGPAIAGWKGRFIRTPLRALLFEDELQKTLFSTIEASTQAYRIAKGEGLTGKQRDARMAVLMQDYNSDAWKQAMISAERHMFQDETDGRVQQYIMGLRNATEVGRWIIPFARTPMSLFRSSVRKSVGAPIVLAIDFKQGKSADHKVRHAAESVISLLGMFGLYSLFSSIGGGSDDDDLPVITGSNPPGKKANRYSTESYTIPADSIRIGRSYYDYRRIEPFGSALSALVTILENFRDYKNGKSATEAALQGWAQFARQFAEHPMLSGVNDVLDASEDPGNLGTKWIQNMAGSFAPNAVKAFARAQDPLVRERRGQTFGEGMKYAAMPVGGDTPYKVDIWGRPVEKSGTTVGRFLSPFKETKTVGTTVTDKLDMLIRKWNEKNPGDPYLPEGPGNSITQDKTSYTLTPEQVESFRVKAGSFALDLLSKKNFNYHNPSDRDIEKVKDALEAGKRRAKMEMLRELRQQKAM